MNQMIRSYLINQCVLGEPIYYEDVAVKLDLDLKDINDRNSLSKVLGEISEFEYRSGRPLVSAIAIYKSKDDHGNGFYKLCEGLGIGKASKLAERLYGFEQMNECKQFWSNSDNFQRYSALDGGEETEEPSFFSEQELSFLAQWAGKAYDKESKEHIAAKNYIMESLGRKTQYWASLILESNSALDKWDPRIWHQRGWQDGENGKILVSKFKYYTWARIFRKGDSKKGVFFTVGSEFDEGSGFKGLVFKLDFANAGSSDLSFEQQKLIHANIPNQARWRTISNEDFYKYDWSLLLDESASFISGNLEVYDKLIALLGDDLRDEGNLSDTLRPESKTPKRRKELPQLNPKFEGRAKDYIQEAIENKELGDAGEELVKLYEIDRLTRIGLEELAQKVDHVQDGAGYDILSFDEDGIPIYIEVKTTTGDIHTPFYYSINEYLFYQENSENYSIWRLYGYDGESNSADFYRITDISKNTLLQPVSYRVYPKGD